MNNSEYKGPPAAIGVCVGIQLIGCYISRLFLLRMLVKDVPGGA
jgi:hypothetical protein